jgi:hypothetical protein
MRCPAIEKGAPPGLRCRSGRPDSAPSQSTLQRNIKVLSEETIASSHRMVLAYGLHQGIDGGKRTRTQRSRRSSRSLSRTSP